ncbi:hypothetical protein I302_106244 [Kwoniella bestiolae CBS 10118]|uniref:Uncharacterized protein n=1 Tax=Kwoniella bestiolae CBS 10118 TaxID=1296100 RepID=A0A1B9G3I3_9TREE|nr:hypothetical protein I302_05368 [Kwoniella bestiolae CBS 10118]OCF25548.1 hypothetical protein I302_05368 [Kwoniella bestiolae CBS 10118]
MLEHIPGVTLPSDGSVCLEGWLTIIVELTIAALGIILLVLITLAFRECFLLYRSKKEREVEESEHELLARNAKEMGIDEKAG